MHRAASAAPEQCEWKRGGAVLRPPVDATSQLHLTIEGLLMEATMATSEGRLRDRIAKDDEGREGLGRIEQLTQAFI
jgi:hypothetical protein